MLRMYAPYTSKVRIVIPILQIRKQRQRGQDLSKFPSRKFKSEERLKGGLVGASTCTLSPISSVSTIVQTNTFLDESSSSLLTVSNPASNRQMAYAHQHFQV